MLMSGCSDLPGGVPDHVGERGDDGGDVAFIRREPFHCNRRGEICEERLRACPDALPEVKDHQAGWVRKEEADVTDDPCSPLSLGAAWYRHRRRRSSQHRGGPPLVAPTFALQARQGSNLRRLSNEAARESTWQVESEEHDRQPIDCGGAAVVVLGGHGLHRGVRTGYPGDQPESVQNLSIRLRW